MKKTAKALAAHGRHGDTELVHMSKGEVRALHGIAGLAGRKLTTNPKTGLPEAFNLFDVLPFALNFIFPGMGTLASVGIGALSGAASSAIEGNDPLTGALTGGVMGGVGSAFGGSDPTQLLTDHAAQAAATAGQGATGALSQAALDAGHAAITPMVQNAAGQAALSGAQSFAGNTAADLAKAGLANATPQVLSGTAPSAAEGFFSNMLSKENLPWTIGGGAALASLLPGESVDTPERKKWKVAQPAAPRTYTPAPSNWLAGFDPEYNMITPNPGPYYQGNPNYSGYAQGGQVGISTLPPAFQDAIMRRNMGGSGIGSWLGQDRSAPPLTLAPRTITQAPSQYPQTQFPPGTTVSGHAVIAPPSITPKLFSPPVAMAAGGGIGGMGGSKAAILQQLLGRHIGGGGAGMDDDVPAMIDGQQPAKLSSGEFVFPADAVSMLGDGNTEAGVNRLKGMIKDIRIAKTGKAGQADPIYKMDPVEDDSSPTPRAPEEPGAMTAKDAAKAARAEKYKRARDADAEFNRKTYDAPVDDIAEGVRQAHAQPFAHDFENHLEGLGGGEWAMRDDPTLGAMPGNTTPVLRNEDRMLPVQMGPPQFNDSVASLTPIPQMDRYVTQMRGGVRKGISGLLTGNDRRAQEARINAMTKEQSPGVQEMIAQYLREPDPAKRNVMRQMLHAMGVGVPGPKTGIGQWRQPLEGGGYKYQ